MDRLNKIERLKDQLHDTDYIAIKASEGVDVTKYGDWKAQRQALREEIDAIRVMTDEEYYNAYPDEVESEISNS